MRGPEGVLYRSTPCILTGRVFAGLWGGFGVATGANCVQREDQDESKSFSLRIGNNYSGVVTASVRSRLVSQDLFRPARVPKKVIEVDLKWVCSLLKGVWRKNRCLFPQTAERSNAIRRACRQIGGTWSSGACRIQASLRLPAPSQLCSMLGGSWEQVNNRQGICKNLCR